MIYCISGQMVSRRIVSMTKGELLSRISALAIVLALSLAVLPFSRISRTCASPNFNCAALACLIVSLISKFTFLTFGNFCSFTFTNLNYLNNMTFKTYENNVSTTNNKPNYNN